MEKVISSCSYHERLIEKGLEGATCPTVRMLHGAGLLGNWQKLVTEHQKQGR